MKKFILPIALLIASSAFYLFVINFTQAQSSDNSLGSKPEVLSASDGRCTVYVAKGSNGNGSKASPFGSIQDALNSDSLGPDDAVCIAGGTYAESLNVKKSGTAQKPILIKNETNNEVVITGSAPTLLSLNASNVIIEGLTFKSNKRVKNQKDNWIGITNRSTSNITFRNNKVTTTVPDTERARLNDPRDAYQDYGIVVNGVNNVLIEKNEINGMQQGIHIRDMAGKKVVVRGNIISRTWQSAIHVSSVCEGGGACSPGQKTLIEDNILELSRIEDGIQFTPGVKGDVTNIGTVVRNNVIRNNAENGVDFKGAKDVLVEKNIIYGIEGDNDGGLVATCRAGPAGNDHCAYGTISKGTNANAENIVVRKNLIFDSAPGFHFRNTSSGYSRNFGFYNNTFVNNNHDYSGANSTYNDEIFFGLKMDSTSGIGIRNNIIVEHQTAEMKVGSNPAGLDSDYNLFFNGRSGGPLFEVGTNFVNFATFKTKTNSDQNSIVANPQFVNVPSNMRPVGVHSKYDFSLKSSSPAKDGGGPLTRASGSGSNSRTLKVAEALFFSDGNGSIAGDLIRVGNVQSRVTGVDIAAKQLTLDTAISWQSGAPVSLAYVGSSMDIGAYEYGSNEVIGLLNGATTPDPVEPDPVEPDPVVPDPVVPDPVEPDPVEPDPVEPPSDGAFGIEGLQGFWNFNTTVEQDDSGLDNDATNSGNVSLNTSGKFGSAVLLNGSNYLRISDSNLPTDFPAKSDNTNEELTVAAWINFSKAGQRNPIIGKQGNQKRGFMFMVDNDNRLTLEVFADNTNTNVTRVFSNTTLSANRWYHVAATYIPGGEAVLYIDGSKNGSASTSVVGPFANNNDFEIGRYFWSSTNNWSFEGLIDEATIFNRSLTSGDIQVLMANDIGAPAPDPVEPDPVEPDPVEPENTRVITGLIAMYSFNSGNASNIGDLTDEPLDLYAEDPNSVNITGGVLKFNNPTTVLSNVVSNKVVNKVKDSNEYTIELWVKPSVENFTKVTSLLGIAKDSLDYNVLITQNGGGIGVITNTSSGGKRVLSMPVDMSTFVQIAFTKDSANTGKLYINGEYVGICDLSSEGGGVWQADGHSLMIGGFPEVVSADPNCTYYVAKSGLDRGGKSLKYAFKTIQGGVDELAPGDKLCIAPDTYNEVVTIDKSGTAGNPIVIRSLDRSAKAVIDGLFRMPEVCTASTCTASNGLLNIKGSYINIENLEVRNSLKTVVEVASAALNCKSTDATKINNINITGSDIHDGNGVAVNLYCVTNSSIASNNIHKAGLGAVSSGTVNTSLLASGVEMTAAKNVFISDNSIHHNWGSGVHFDTELGQSSNITVEKNTLYDSYKEGVHVRGATNSTVKSNFIYETTTTEFASTYAGINVQISAGALSTNRILPSNITVYNNVISNRNTGIRFNGSKDSMIARNSIINPKGYGLQNGGSSTNFRVRDNIVIVSSIGKNEGYNGGLYVGDTNTIDFSHNLWSQFIPEIEGPEDLVLKPADVLEIFVVRGAVKPTAYNSDMTKDKLKIVPQYNAYGADLDSEPEISGDMAKDLNVKGNLLPNASFETTPVTEYKKVGQGTGGVEQSGRSGSKSLYLDVLRKGNLGSWETSANIPVTSGKLYRANAWIKMVSGTANGSGEIMVSYYNASGVLLKTYVSPNASVGTNDWQLIVVESTAPANATAVKFEMRLTGTAKAFYDDVSLMQVN